MTRNDALIEFLKRHRLRTSLEAWCEYALEPQGQRPAAHHRLLIEGLEALARGDIRRLMVAMPPGSAKSTYVSTLFPPWWLAQDPTKSMIAASNTAELAERFGRRVRNTIQEHSSLLGYGISDDNAAAGRWETTAGGEYYAAGVQGTITGRRCDLAIIDDPVKTRAEADSQLIRDRIWAWWKDDLMTRMKPGGCAVVVATRWHEDDLSGRLLNEAATGGPSWHTILLPMEAEGDDALGRVPGERLWPNHFTAEDVAAAKRETRTWSALYQQRPAPETGDYFQRDWIRPAEPPPRDSLRVFMASDYAVTADGGDYTVHVVVGIDSDDRIYLLDLWRGQTSSEKWVEAFCDLVIQWRPLAAAEETGQIRAGVGPWLDRRCRERRAWVARKQFPTRGDKAVRAQSIRGRMALCGLFVPPAAPWRADLEAELMSFPAGKHDDQCLAEGTLITMADGSKQPIERVVVGSSVATPIGACVVSASAVTRDDAAVFRVKLAGGVVIEATGNHPVAVQGKGFVRVDALNIMDHLVMEPLSCGVEAQRPRWLNTKGIDNGVIRKAGTYIIGAISTVLIRVEGFYIAIYGRMSADLFLPATTSTIATKTLSTTTFPIWSVSRSASIGGGTPSLSKGRLNTSLFSGLLRRSGIVARSGASGIARMALRAGLVERLSRSSVRLAERGLKRLSSGLGSALEDASSVAQAEARAAAVGMWPKVKRWLVSAVRGTSSPNGRTPHFIAQKRAGCVIEIEELSQRARVRNLTVSRAHVFYANGVLTHNCDALGLAGQLLDMMVAPSKPKPPQAPGDTWARAFARSRGGEDSWKAV